MFKKLIVAILLFDSWPCQIASMAKKLVVAILLFDSWLQSNSSPNCAYGEKIGRSNSSI